VYFIFRYFLVHLLVGVLAAGTTAGVTSVEPDPGNAPGAAATAPSSPAEAAGAGGDPQATVPSTPVRPGESRDVVVYGGTPGGVAAAIAAAEHRADVVLIAEGSTIGGQMSNGISASDIGSALSVQGIALDFFERVREHYGDPGTWRFEPHVAETVLRGMLDDAGVDVLYRAPLRYVHLSGRTIDCITVSSPLPLCADTFIDASYTGDLIRGARVPHRLGMGDFHAYGETLALRREWVDVVSVAPEEVEAARVAFAANPFVTMPDGIRPYEQAVQAGTPSLAYRLCVTEDPANRTPFRAAAGYDDYLPSFRLMARAFSSEIEVKSNGTLLSDAFHLAVIPGGKYDLNSGLMTLTNLPAPADYFSSAAARKAHDRTLRDYVESFFHFVGNDDAVPSELREAFAPFGLCADEFTDNGNWPREPYVREARRIEGRYTMTQADIYTRREKASSVAFGAYNVDGKSSQIVFADGRLLRDSTMFYSAPTYEIPFEVMLPKQGSVLNLLAPVGPSSSPTAYSSLRMEPQYMALGQAAGVAAALATKTGATVAQVPVAEVQAWLRWDGVQFKLRDLCQQTPRTWRSAGGYTDSCEVVPVQPREA
jgi:hypothetical protein